MELGNQSEKNARKLQEQQRSFVLVVQRRFSKGKHEVNDFLKVNDRGKAGITES